MKSQKSRRVNSLYALIQALYWMSYALMFNYASLYLQSKGFGDGRIGLVLGATYLLSALLQPAFAKLVNRSGLRLNVAMSGVYLLTTLLSLTLWLAPLRGGLLSVVMIAAFTLHSAMQPSLNSLYQGFEISGIAVNFGLARGIGSFCYALIALFMGQLLSRVAPNILPAFYMTGQLLLALCLILFRAPDYRRGASDKSSAYRDIIRAHPGFVLFLLSVACLGIAHIFIDNFMLQILQSMGAGSGSLGIAIAIGGFTELPAMALYARMSRRVGNRRILRVMSCVWLVKDVLTLLARHPALIYLAALLQFFSFAVYVPAAVEYISVTLPKADFLAGQSLQGSAWTLGSVAATFLGGQLIDVLGIRGALAAIQFFAVAGVVLMMLCGAKSKKA